MAMAIGATLFVALNFVSIGAAVTERQKLFHITAIIIVSICIIIILGSIVTLWVMATRG